MPQEVDKVEMGVCDGIRLPIADERNCYLYRHIRLDKNEPFYIGIGLKTGNPSRYESEYRRAYERRKRNPFWKNIVAKTDYEVELLLDHLTHKQAQEKEIEFIALYGRNDIGAGTLVNLTDGGGGVIGKSYSKEHSERTSAALRAQYAAGTRVPLKSHSEETKQKMRESRIGRKCSIEVRAKMSYIQKNRVLSEEAKISVASAQALFTIETVREIKALRKSGVFIRDIAKIYNCGPSTIHRLVTNKTYKRFNE